MASYLDTYVDAIFAFTPPTDQLIITVYGLNPSDLAIPDVTNVIAQSDPVTVLSVGALIHFPFSSDPVFPGGQMWLAISRTGTGGTSNHYRLINDNASDNGAGFSSLFGWSVTTDYAGFSGKLVINDVTIFDRPIGAPFQDFGDGDIEAEQFANFGRGARIWKRI